MLNLNSDKRIISVLFTINLALQIITQAAFASMFDTPVAMITSFEGKVNFENSTQRQVDFGTDIFIGDMLKTAENASISLTFYNGCRQEIIDQNTLIQVGNNQSVLRKGQFKQVDILDCKIPQVILQESDSHLKAGLVVRSVETKEASVNISSFLSPLVKTSGKISGNTLNNTSNKEKDLKLKAWTNHGKQPSFKIGEPIVLHFISNQNAYVLVNYYSSNGELYQLTADLLLDNNKISSKKLYTLGSKGSELIAGLPAGIDTIHILVSNKPFKINNRIEKSLHYFQMLKKYINENPQQLYSEKQIKLTISQ